MRLENMREGFPQMPEEMRIMVEKEVARQIKIERPEFHKKQKKATGGIYGKKLAIIALAATMVMGLTAAAGARIYQMYSEKEENYGARIGVNASGTATNVIPEVDIQVGYVPEGMYECTDLCGKGKYHYENTEIPHTGGITLVKIVMDSEGDLNAMTEANVVEREEMIINEHEAVLLKKHMISGGGVNYSRIIYVLYPEVQHILQMFVGDDVPEEEMIKMAESIELVPTGNTVDEANAYTWNDQVEQEKDVIIRESKLTASKEEMENLHDMGEDIPVMVYAETPDGERGHTEGIQIKVSKVQVSDDLSLLEKTEYVDERWKNAVGDDGKLVMDTVQYVKSGDGINTIDEIVKTEEKAQKLVYVTLKYTNTGEQELRNVLFYHTMLAMEEWEEGYAYCDWIKQQEEGTWDRMVNTSAAGLGEMYYYDIHDEEQGKNYISSLAPGETVTLHIASIVHEDQLPYLYLDLTGPSHEFSERGLETGLVDIRQEHE